MQQEIARLNDMLAQLPLNQQERVVPRFIEIVEWLSEPDTAEDGSVSRSIGFTLSKGRTAFDVATEKQQGDRIERERRHQLDEEDFAAVLAKKRAVRLLAEAGLHKVSERGPQSDRHKDG